MYGDLNPSKLNTWFLWPTRVHIPNGISIGLAGFTKLTAVTDRPSDIPRYSVCSNRPHLASAAMRTDNNNTRNNVYGAVVRTEPLRELNWFILMNAD